MNVPKIKRFGDIHLQDLPLIFIHRSLFGPFMYGLTLHQAIELSKTSKKGIEDKTNHGWKMFAINNYFFVG